jgi:hypothetical protein
MASDPDLLAIARRQLESVMAEPDAMAFLGWWLAWSQQAGVERDDLIDMVKDPAMLALIGDNP